MPAIAEKHLPESQCGFRANRSTTHMVFVLRQLQENVGSKTAFYVTIMDFTKAFYIMSRIGLWQILERLGCSPKFLTMVIQFHEDHWDQLRHGNDL